MLVGTKSISAINYLIAAENIAKGYATLEVVVDGWMNNKGHRENILTEEFTHVGVGYAKEDTEDFLNEPY